MRAQAEAAVLARLPLGSDAGGAHAAAPDLAAVPDLAAAASAADQAAAAAALLAVSGDGRWAAVASRQNVHLVDLARLQGHGMLPALQARPIARASQRVRNGLSKPRWHVSVCVAQRHAASVMLMAADWPVC